MFTKQDIISSLVIGEIVALFILGMVTNLQIVIPFVWLVIFVLPILALIGLYVAYLIGEKIRVIYQIAKFTLVGFSNVAIDFGVLNLLMYLTNIYGGERIILLNVMAFVVAVINSFFWNKFWTFGAKESNGGGKEFLQFIIIAAIGAVINTGIVYGLTTYISPSFGLDLKLWANFAKVLATFVSLAWNFTGYKFLVFKK